MTELTLTIDGRHFLFAVIGIIVVAKSIWHYICLFDEVLDLRRRLGRD
jgi:hypothetical protein